MTLTPEEIRARIDDLDQRVGWYQDIDLGNDLHTKTRVFWGESIDHPRQRWEAVLGGSPGGHVWDVGAGYRLQCGIPAIRGQATRGRLRAGRRPKAGVHRAGQVLCRCARTSMSSSASSISTRSARLAGIRPRVLRGILYHCRYLSQAVDQVSEVSSDTWSWSQRSTRWRARSRTCASSALRSTSGLGERQQAPPGPLAPQHDRSRGSVLRAWLHQHHPTFQGRRPGWHRSLSLIREAPSSGLAGPRTSCKSSADFSVS